jgi:hypothetical protein
MQNSLLQYIADIMYMLSDVLPSRGCFLEHESAVSEVSFVSWASVTTSYSNEMNIALGHLCAHVLG